MSESPVCPQVPTANSAVEDVGLRAGVGPAEYSFLSPALSSVRGAQIAPPALRGAVMLPLGPPPTLPLPGPVDTSSHAPLKASPAPRVCATHSSIPLLPPGWPLLPTALDPSSPHLAHR